MVRDEIHEILPVWAPTFYFSNGCFSQIGSGFYTNEEDGCSQQVILCSLVATCRDPCSTPEVGRGDRKE